MLSKAKTKDEATETQLKELELENEKVSGFDKLMPFNKPAYLIVVGCIAALINGALMPICGIVLSKLLAYLTAQWEVLEAMDSELTGRQYLEKQIKFYSLAMGVMSIVAAFASFT